MLCLKVLLFGGVLHGREGMALAGVFVCNLLLAGEVRWANRFFFLTEVFRRSKSIISSCQSSIILYLLYRSCLLCFVVLLLELSMISSVWAVASALVHSATRRLVATHLLNRYYGVVKLTQTICIVHMFCFFF